MRRVTLKDVAKTCGYSVNCVSRALMDADDIATTTKQRIKQIAEEMGYVPHMSASILRKGNSNRIGILCDNLLNPFYSVITNYMQWKFVEKGYTFVTFYTTRQLFGADDVKQIVASDVDGLICFLGPDAEATAMLLKFNLPTVILGRKSDDFDSVVLDNFKGGYIITKRLIDSGRRNIVYIGENNIIDCSIDRGEGYTKAMKENNLTPVSFCAYERGSYENVVEQMVKDNIPFDAIFCFNDFGAYVVMDRLSEMGITDKSVAGFDEIRKELRFYGKVDSVGYDKQSFAQKAVDMLFERIRKSNIGQPKMVVEDVYLV